MPESINVPAPLDNMTHPTLEELEAQLTAGNEKKRFQAALALAELGAAGTNVLQSFLLQHSAEGAIAGRCYELLLHSEIPESQAFLAQHFPDGVVPLLSEAGIDYRPLQQLLAAHNFLEGDRLTLQKLCELSGAAAMKRKWLYFSEVESLPITDLHTINQLWLVHSEGKFGFSVQRQLWLSVGKNWEALWPKIKWKSGKTWTRYPGEFIWDLSAPRGHLPLSNQLRGVQTINALLSHPAWLAS
ncbi:MAG: GUN4 domain-containing protein [Thermosynechococcaceae cyanobacterium MS004]|nr:GUN4 domain-containing protein [Thermosynechococcaceae cyanobacterium MS004]